MPTRDGSEPKEVRTSTGAPGTGGSGGSQRSNSESKGDRGAGAGTGTQQRSNTAAKTDSQRTTVSKTTTGNPRGPTSPDGIKRSAPTGTGTAAGNARVASGMPNNTNVAKSAPQAPARTEATKVRDPSRTAPPARQTPQAPISRAGRDQPPAPPSASDSLRTARVLESPITNRNVARQQAAAAQGASDAMRRNTGFPAARPANPTDPNGLQQPNRANATGTDSYRTANVAREAARRAAVAAANPPPQRGIAPAQGQPYGGFVNDPYTANRNAGLRAVNERARAQQAAAAARAGVQPGLASPGVPTNPFGQLQQQGIAATQARAEEQRRAQAAAAARAQYSQYRSPPGVPDPAQDYNNLRTANAYGANFAQPNPNPGTTSMASLNSVFGVPDSFNDGYQGLGQYAEPQKEIVDRAPIQGGPYAGYGAPQSPEARTAEAEAAATNMRRSGVIGGPRFVDSIMGNPPATPDQAATQDVRIDPAGGLPNPMRQPPGQIVNDVRRQVAVQQGPRAPQPQTITVPGGGLPTGAPGQQEIVRNIEDYNPQQQPGTQAPSQQYDGGANTAPSQNAGQPQNLAELANRYSYEKGQIKDGFRNLPGKIYDAITGGDFRAYDPIGDQQGQRGDPAIGNSGNGGQQQPVDIQQLLNMIAQLQGQGGVSDPSQQLQMILRTFV